MSALRKLAAATALFASVHSAQAMTYQYSVEKGRLVIQAAGDIELDERQRFLQFTDGLPPLLFAPFENKVTIVFDSRGGNLSAGFALARIVWSFHMTTSVAKDGLCASACVVMWAAGMHKQMEPRSRLGVHNASFTGAAIAGVDGPQAERLYTGVFADWIRRNGAPPNVIAKTMSTPADSMYWLTAEDLADWHVTIGK